MRMHASVLLLFLALAFPALLAAEYPSKERGLTADTAYQMGEVDHVNLFNGNLSITLPIGRQYPLGPSLSYGLVLSYNSNVWDYRPKDCFDPINQVRIDYVLPEPSARSNGGVGWELHLGRLLEPNQLPMNDGGEWIYLAGDGSQHAFYSELHPGSGTQANTLFTSDGSYLRLRYFQSGDTKCKPVDGDSGVCRLVESPDGSVREFRNFLGEWKLTRLHDAFGNWLDISYSGNTWTLSDIHGRSHTLIFQGNLLSQVKLSGPNGTTSTYTPSYTQTSIKRQNYTKPTCAPVDHGNDISVALLTGVEQPDAILAATTGPATAQIRYGRLPSVGSWGTCTRFQVTPASTTSWEVASNTTSPLQMASPGNSRWIRPPRYRDRLPFRPGPAPILSCGARGPIPMMAQATFVVSGP